ncbi:MAG: leucine-rich repeat domain-containing protein [Candidatus Thorarchaeota archaeon]
MARYTISGVTSDSDRVYLVDEDTKRIWLSNEELINIDLASIELHQEISEIYIDNNDIRSIDLNPLSDFTSLEVLSLGQNKIQSIDLSPIHECKELRWLSLSNNRLTEIDVSPLANCENLQNLYLSGNRFSSIDLKPLENCRELREVVLSKSVDDSLDLGINLTPFLSARRLKKIGLYENQRVTLGLKANQFRNVPAAVSQCLKKCRNISVDQLVLSRIESLGPRRGLEDLEQDIHEMSAEYWFSVQKDMLRPLGLEVIAGFDGDISKLAPIRRIKDWESKVIVKASEAIEKGARTTLLNLDNLDLEIGSHVMLHSAILKNRLDELNSVKVYVCEGAADLREIWYTAWGFNFLSKMRAWIFAPTGNYLIKLRNMLRELGFDIEFIPIRIKDPWPRPANQPSEMLRGVILGSAERTVDPNIRNRVMALILKNEHNPLLGEYERIVRELNREEGV